MHPELGDPETPYWIREQFRATTEASRILTAADRLTNYLRAYRTAIALVRDQQLETDPGLPF